MAEINGNSPWVIHIDGERVIVVSLAGSLDSGFFDIVIFAGVAVDLDRCGLHEVSIVHASGLDMNFKAIIESSRIDIEEQKSATISMGLRVSDNI